MKHLRLLAAFVFAFAGQLSAATGSDAPAASAAPAAAPEKIEIPGVKLTYGPATAKLGSVAEIKIPEHFAFVGADGLDKFFEYTHNFRSGNEVGVILSPAGWVLFFDYDSIGYVKDSDKDQLNADKMYSSMLESQSSGNEHRRSKGWAEHKLEGWATKPHYDPKTNNLTWAFKFSTSTDQYKTINVNSNIRLLGRSGVVNVTLATGTENFTQDEVDSNRLLSDFTYVAGEKYAEFKKGDKIAEIGLAALVLGGAGAIAYKTGFLAKFWKVLVMGIAAIGAGISKLWKKITGGGSDTPKSPWRQE